MKKIAIFIILFSIFLIGILNYDDIKNEFKDVFLITQNENDINSKSINHYSEENNSDNTFSDNYKTNDIENYRVVIDPGHQKYANNDNELVDPRYQDKKIKVSQGTKGISSGMMEYELNLQASKILKQKLTDKNIEVFLTRTNNDVNISNKERAELANELSADIFIRVHADGSQTAETRGAHILIPSRNHKNEIVYSKSDYLGKILIQKLNGNIELKSNPISYRDDISGFNWSNVPVVLFEMGFMTNPNEDLLLSNPDYIDKMMSVIADGIEEYLQLQSRNQNNN